MTAVSMINDAETSNIFNMKLCLHNMCTFDRKKDIKSFALQLIAMFNYSKEK